MADFERMTDDDDAWFAAGIIAKATGKPVQPPVADAPELEDDEDEPEEDLLAGLTPEEQREALLEAILEIKTAETNDSSEEVEEQLEGLYAKLKALEEPSP